MAKKTGKKTTKRTTAKPKKTSKKVSAKAVAATRPLPKLPSIWVITKTAALTIWDHKQLFFGITIIYGLLNVLLVQGLATNTDVTGLKGGLDKVFNGHFGGVASSVSVFILLVGSAGNGSSQTAGAYQLILALITSLAVIWALRQVLANKSIRIRDAYYRGMYPLIPFVLVLLMIGLQLIPLLFGSVLYTSVISSGIAVHVIEKVLWGLACAGLVLVSLYWISSSIFALYIVTLPDMTPMKAMRSARKIVRGRRWIVLRKIVALPVILLLVAAIIMLPIILWLTPLAQWVFFFLTMFALVGVHAYSYMLYRELLNE